MKRSKRSLRQVVLGRMFELLDRSYGIDMSREQFVGTALSHHELEAILSFKSDPQLEELHGALSRIDDNTYGVCIGCKQSIAEEVLVVDPARRVCVACEREFNKPVLHAEQSWLHQ